MQDQIGAHELDVLVFNDIGLSQHTWFLAFARFAPVQCLTLSNGMTSGLDTIDYYVSTVNSQPGMQAQVCLLHFGGMKLFTALLLFTSRLC